LTLDFAQEKDAFTGGVAGCKRWKLQYLGEGMPQTGRAFSRFQQNRQCRIGIAFMNALFEILKPGERDWELASALDSSRLPSHIAVIMDGNGRWARRRGLPRVAGHKAGVDPVRITVETCARLGIQALTLYAFSVENWKRPRTEVNTLWQLLHIYLRRELPNLQKNGIQLQAIGRLDALPPEARAELGRCVAATSGNRGLRVNLAINYGGRSELVDAVNAIIEDARISGRLSDLRVEESDIAAHLYTSGQPDPDLLIRTSGEMRISNFLLWQIAYAELHVTPTLWPDFQRADLLEAILDYQKRDRRFGGLGSPRNGIEVPAETAVEVLGSPVR
jgi:undecaprenyl diphosphate synthase